MKFPNTVGQIREERGLSREQLAEAVGATRQTIGLIETGKVCPSTVLALRIAKRLGVSVEYLFADPDDIMPLLISDDDSEELSLRDTQRVWVAQRNGRRFARPADASVGWNRPAHAIWQRQDSGRGGVPDAEGFSDSFHSSSRAPRGKLNWLTHPSIATGTVFVSGCDVGLGLLAECLGRPASTQGVWFEVPNRRAFWELQNGLTHVAAIHGMRSVLGTHPAGLSPDDYLAVEFASAEMGWMVRRGNPEGFSSAEDLSGGRLRFVNRPLGSGARRHVDSLLEQEGVRASSVTGYDTTVGGHRAVAEAVAQGLADVGFGHSAAASALSLTFLPVLEEVCTLVIPRSEIALPAVQALLDTLQSDRFRMELCALGPYEVVHTGKVEYRS